MDKKGKKIPCEMALIRSFRRKEIQTQKSIMTAIFSKHHLHLHSSKRRKQYAFPKEKRHGSFSNIIVRCSKGNSIDYICSKCRSF